MKQWTLSDLRRLTPNMACRCCHELHIQLVTIKRLRELEKQIGKRLEVTNGYRCKLHNAKVGGHEKSRHMQGLAVDVVDPGIRFFQKTAKEYFGGVKHYPEKGIYHLQVPGVGE